MDQLTEFVGTERRNYADMGNNSFAFAFAQFIRYYVFLQMIYKRYETASDKFRENTRLVAKQPSGPLGPEGATIYLTTEHSSAMS